MTCIQRTVPSDLYFLKWKDILNRVLQGFILSPILHNIFINEEGDRTECTYIY